jgi:hypothetical protein
MASNTSGQMGSRKVASGNCLVIVTMTEAMNLLY